MDQKLSLSTKHWEYCMLQRGRGDSDKAVLKHESSLMISLMFSLLLITALEIWLGVVFVEVSGECCGSVGCG